MKMKNERPLVDALTTFVNEHPTSLHVPGHKNGLLTNLPNEIKQALTYDVTELSGLDDFHHPEEAIKEAEQLLAKTYESDASFFLVNGSTVGNLAMVYATCKAGDTIIVQRNAHKSIFHAIELVGANPVFISPEWDEETKTASHVETATLKEALGNYPHAKAVVFTTPTYYGLVSEQLEEQITLCHELNIPVLIDEAHGAHFVASKQFPKSALQLGADLVVQSAHKTLPAMTMGSYLHVRSNLIDIDVVNRYLRMLQSSSPSYMIMASLDDARHYVATYLESDYMYLNEKRNNFINGLKLIKGVEIVEVHDPLKLLLRVRGYSGYELKEALEQESVYVELADMEQVLMILPLLKQGVTYPFTSLRTRIKDAITNLLKTPKQQKVPLSMQLEVQKVSKPIVPITKARQSEQEWIPYTKAIGRISAELIIPYPPGIPLFVVGEKITVAKLTYLTDLLACGAEFQGNHQLQEKQICVLK
jgi:arginine/lysine/ornithine decarboxylase